MAGEWTEERRAGARERALKSQLWKHSTGPKTEKGRERSKMNALKHGGRSALFADVRKNLAEQDKFMNDCREKLVCHQARGESDNIQATS